MVWLNDEDIRTPEIRDWQGIHLLHFQGSSCSQKTRIFLGLKGIDWQSHHIDLPAGEQHTEWFMGINPRGLVPVLVHDGRVMIESNDILSYLESCFRDPPLLPEGSDTARRLLQQEDALHLDFRAISFRYFFPGVTPRPQESIDRYRALGSGTVGGVVDEHKPLEVEFFEDMLAEGGISEARIRLGVERFEVALNELDGRLDDGPFLLGEALSIVDIAWYIYVHRLMTARYPMAEKHPQISRWFEQLDTRDDFRREVAEPPPLTAARSALHQAQAEARTTLVDIAGI